MASDAVLAKARDLLLEQHVSPAGTARRYDVREYVVHVGTDPHGMTYLTCTCEHGRRAQAHGPTTYLPDEELCSHMLAAHTVDEYMRARPANREET